MGGLLESLASRVELWHDDLHCLGEEDGAKGSHQPESPAALWAQVALDEWSSRFFQRNQGPWAGEKGFGGSLSASHQSGIRGSITSPALVSPSRGLRKQLM